MNLLMLVTFFLKIGYVCSNMLSAAVCGGVFASPSYQDVLKAIIQVANKSGVLLVIKNYTGDRINFTLATNIARSKGIEVETLIVADDVSFEEVTELGGRGLAGTVLLYKILGYAANETPLKDLKILGEKILKKTYTIGASLTACSLPGNPPMYVLPEDEMEIGLGIHGEKGLKRTKLLKCDDIINEIAKKIPIKDNTEIVILINNLGSCTELEMMIIARAALNRFKDKKVVRLIIGRIMTSLEMHGFSLTVFDLDECPKDLVLKALDDPITCSSWNISVPNADITVPLKEEISSLPKQKQELSEAGNKFKKILHELFSALKSKGSYYNQLDAEVGDGDLGIGVSNTSELILKNLDYFPWEENVVGSFNELGQLMAQGFGGTTGPLYAFFFLEGSKKLNNKLQDNTMNNWCEAFEDGMKAIQEIGKAKVGDRTMIDAMDYVLKAFKEGINENKDAVSVAKTVAQAASKGAEEASKLKAKRGRSSYLQGKEVGKKEPGCELVKDWIQLIAEGISTLH